MNILVENAREGKIKICDFGLSKKEITTVGETMTRTFGTPAYAAPGNSTIFIIDIVISTYKIRFPCSYIFSVLWIEYPISFPAFYITYHIIIPDILKSVSLIHQ